MELQIITLNYLEQKIQNEQLSNGSDNNARLTELRCKHNMLKTELEEKKDLAKLLQDQIETSKGELETEKQVFEQWKQSFISIHDTFAKKTDILENFAEAEDRPDFGIKALKPEFEFEYKNYMTLLKPFEMRRRAVLQELKDLKSLEEEAKKFREEATKLMAPTH